MPEDRSKHYREPQLPRVEGQVLKETGQHLQEYLVSAYNRGLSEAAIARELNVSRNTLRKWRGRFGVTIKRIAVRSRRKV